MNKNCIYYTLYGNQKYINLLKISLESLNNFFSKDDIFIFTNINADSLKEYANIVNYNFNDGFAIPMSERFNILNTIPSKYDSILHLDTDTVCIGNPAEIFESIKKEKILVATETPNFSKEKKYLNLKSYLSLSTNKCIEEYWAGPLLNEDEKFLFKNIDSICAGVFACSSEFKIHGKNIYNFISSLEKNGFYGVCGDQHGFCKYLLAEELYDFSLQKYVSHQGKHIILNKEVQLAVDAGISILHFAGGVQPSEEKLSLMKLAMEKL